MRSTPSGATFSMTSRSASSAEIINWKDTRRATELERPQPLHGCRQNGADVGAGTCNGFGSSRPVATLLGSALRRRSRGGSSFQLDEGCFDVRAHQADIGHQVRLRHHADREILIVTDYRDAIAHVGGK